jgi:hypothetical protein
MATVIEKPTHLGIELENEHRQLFITGAGHPNIPLDLMSMIFDKAGLVETLRGPERMMAVFTFVGDLPNNVYICRGPVPRGDTFNEDVFRLWSTYRVGAEIPVIITRIDPPFTGVLICPISGLPGQVPASSPSA